MTLRSRQTRWFEVYLRREQVVYALEALAGTQSVQLELDPRFTGSLNINELERQLREFDRLAESHRDLLPGSADEPTRLAGPPELVVENMLQRLRRWCARLEPLRAQSEALKPRQDQLQILEQAAIAMGQSAAQLPRIAHSTELLFKRLFRCPPRVVESAVFDGHLEQSFAGEDHCFVVIVCLPEQSDNVIHLLNRAGCAEVVIPQDLAEQPGRQLRDIRQRLDQVQADIEHVEEQIGALRKDAGIAEALANVETLRWFTEAAHQVGIKDAEFCHITGWTSETDCERLEKVLERAQVQADVRFARPPAGVTEPVAGATGWWRQPFQIFTAMSGAPSPDEVDPTGLLAIVVPLLFGYMFPDTGHGLIIAVAGIVLSLYTFKARFLISCGIVSALMGILFDDFFGYQMLNQSWQIHALDNPVLVLIIPMFFGLGLLLLGLVFNGIEDYWRGELRRWLLSDAAVMVLYVSLLLSLLYVQALLIGALALLWYIIGAVMMSGQRRASRAAIAVGELAHGTLALLLNTISFVRVGAFALAHGGLSMVVITLAESVETPILSMLLFTIGQVVIIVLEGLLVFVQTTRLVLFEFFTQFLRADGRFFRPLPASKSPREL